MNVLQKILDNKFMEVELLKMKYHIPSLKMRALDSPPARDMVAAIEGCKCIPIIAEIKRASPSRGKIRAIKDVAGLARAYQDGGAVAISVVTDSRYFGGSILDLSETKMAVDVPVLRKDFIIHPVQLYESRIWGADAVLLIAEALDPPRLKDLYLEAIELGMTPLVEIHSHEEIDKVMELDPPIAGINNRDLSTMKCSLETCQRLRPMIPEDVIVVGESGIRSREDIDILLKSGVDAFLIGTALMDADDPFDLVRSFCKKEGMDG